MYGRILLKVLKQVHDENTVFIDKLKPEDNLARLREIFAAIEEQKADKIKIGRLLGKSETAVGDFGEQMVKEIKNLITPDKFSEVSLDHVIARLMSVHDETAIKSIKKSATLSVRLAQDVLIVRVEEVLDNELKESHAQIAAKIEEALDDREKQEEWAKLGINPEAIDIVYASVQSGKNCDLKVTHISTNELLGTDPGTIIVAVGAKYYDFTSNVIRTLMFNSTKEKRQLYQLTCDALDFGISLLTPGRTFSEVHDKIKAFVQDKNPKLLDCMTKSFGHSLSIEFKESSLMLIAKTNEVIVAGMAFNISIGFANYDDGKQKYSIWLADTVLVRPTGEEPLVLTSALDRQFKAINYQLDDEPPEEAPAAAINNKTKQRDSAKGDAKGKTSPAKPAKNENQRPTFQASQKTSAESVVLRDRLRSRNKTNSLEETEKLLLRQTTLRKRKLEEIRERFKDGANFATNKRSIRKMTSIISYRDPTEYPKDLKPNRIHLDPVKEAVLVPIPGFGHVPFHVSTIRNVFCQAEDKKYQIFRIQFQVPGSIGFGYKADANPFPEVSGPDGMFVKELMFRSCNPQLPQMVKSVKDLQKRVKQREESGDSSQEVSAPVQLELNRKGGKRVLLKNVMVKTGTQTRRTTGSLETHLNGLRFQGGRSDLMDIHFTNILHAIFQPCVNELLVLIHFHLKNPILVNKKKVQDVQFYTEVGAQTDDLDQRRGRSNYDPDEIAEEQRERETRKRLNVEFKRFVESTEEAARSGGFQLEFDLPQRELAFHGVPKNSSQLMFPTTKALVQLTEWPVFVLTLSDIEIVSFERVLHGLRQFDVVFVFKDYTKPVQQITTIPTESLDPIKRWLNEIDVVWYESKNNLNWTEILRTIRDDVEGFVSDGGFEIFLGEGGSASNVDEGEVSQSDEEDEEYKEAQSDDSDDDAEDYSSESGSKSSDDDDDDDAESLASEGSLDGDVDEEVELESEEEEGLSWDEMEKRAIKDDRKRGNARSHDEIDEDDSDDGGRRRKKRKESKGNK